MTLPEETEITVWGPTQSGKDWLYRGFVKALEEYTHKSEDFDFKLQKKHPTDKDFTLVRVEPPDGIVPTSAGEDYIHVFSRKPKLARSNDDKLKISAYTHYINFHNNRGSDLVAALLDPERFETALLPVKRSPYILVILDPNFEQSEALSLSAEDIEEYPEMALKPGLTKAQYYEILTILLETLANEKIPNRQVAVCITKTDMLKISSNDTWYLLERVFGQRIQRLFYNYKSIFNIEVFATSAAGYVVKRGKFEANFSDGKLLDQENWNPVNCAAPFFWMFQKKEIEQIKKNSNFLNKESNLRSYVRYPSPLRNF